jgi:hypothetical protein
VIVARAVYGSRRMSVPGALRHILFAAWLAPAIAHAQEAEVTVSESVEEVDEVAEAIGLPEEDPSTELSAPAIDDERAAEPRGAAEPQQRPRYWRYPREVVRRPLTLPQFVGRLDSIVAASAGSGWGGFFVSGFMSIAGGIFDELEIGATPLAITFWPPLNLPSDPYTYFKARVLGGDVQLAFRAGTTLPFNRQSSAQMVLGAELAWLATPLFRLDVALDYQLLFSSPLHQRVGIPVTGTFQADIHAIALTTGVFVFNDFDDVDVPLVLSYNVTFNGYRQPHGEWGFEAGFLDLERGVGTWTLRSRFTFFV